MNAEAFYADYKAALAFLGIEWANKDAVKMFIQGDFLVFTVPGREARIRIPYGK